MELVVGVILALCACGLGTIAGFERDRAFYPVMMIVIASYYDLFAVLGGDERVLVAEMAFSAVFVFLALIGFRTSLWIVAAALLGHAGFDVAHAHIVANPGAPSWWPMFCASIDTVAAFYLSWRLLLGRIEARDRHTFGDRICAYVDVEFMAAQTAERNGDPNAAFRHLERAHVLGQRSTLQHVRAHARMLMWGLRRRNRHEVMGQVARLIGAAAKTWAGFIPQGNTGGASVSAFKSMPIPDDLACSIAAARLRCPDRE